MLTVLRSSLLSIQVCTVIKEPAKVVAETNRVHLCGTTHGWMIVEEDHEMLNGDKNPVQCADHPDRQYWLLLC